MNVDDVTDLALRYRKVIGGLRTAVVDFVHGRDSNTNEMGDFHERIHHYTDNLYAANAVSSQIDGKPGRHKVLMDLDCPHVYVPSSREGHGHLIIDVDLAWPAYLEMLKVLARHHILEWGFVSAAQYRGATWLRLPWATKEWEVNHGPASLGGR